MSDIIFANSYRVITVSLSSARTPDNDDKTVSFLSFSFFCLIYLQKLAIPLSGSGAQISLVLLIFYVRLIYAISTNVLMLNVRLTLLFGFFVCVSLLAQMGSYDTSIPGYVFILIVQFLLCFYWTLPVKRYQEACARFTFYMLPIVPIVLAQFIFEVFSGNGHSLSIETLIPKPLLLQGFVYEGSIPGWVVWNRPNGLFLLEPSFCSAFLAVAAIFELVSLNRPCRAVFFITGVVITNGGTGTLLLSIALPVYAAMRYPAQTAVGAIALLLVAASVGSSIEKPPLFLSRLSELQDEGSSGYGRLAQPLILFANLITDPAYLVKGAGAGKITTDIGGASWPIVKLLFEYGALTAVTYFVMTLAAATGSFSIPYRIAFFIVFQFTGGYLPGPLMYMLFFLTLCGNVTEESQKPLLPEARSSSAIPELKCVHGT